MSWSECPCTIPPRAEPIELAEFKAQAKIDTDLLADDALMKALIPAARGVVEVRSGEGTYRQVAMVVATYTAIFWGTPAGDSAALPYVPLVSISSVTYLDTSGTSATWASTNYRADTASGRIVLQPGCYWPATYGGPGSFTVTFVAGIACPFTASGATLTGQGRTYTNGDLVRVVNSGGVLPTLLAPLTNYYVVSVSGSAFGLSATSGGTAITTTNAGSGTHFVVGVRLADFEKLRQAMFLLLNHWYRNRDSVVIGTITAEVPMGVAALCSAAHA